MHLGVYRSLYAPTTTTAIESGQFPDCAVAITLDDGYRSVIEHAVPIMRRHGFVGTVYLTTSAVGNHALLWPNELCWFLSQHRESTLAAIAQCAPGLSSDASAFDAVNYLCANSSHRSILEMLSSLRSKHGIDAEELASDASLYLTWEEVASLREEGFAFGNHTHTHPDCTKLPRDELVAEMMASESILQGHSLGKSSFAYPFGANSPADRRVLGEFGFSSVMVLDEIGNSPIDLRRISRIGSEAKTAALLFADLEIVSPFRSFVRRVLERSVR